MRKDILRGIKDNMPQQKEFKREQKVTKEEELTME